LNPRPPGYEPGELPDCSTPRRERQYTTVDAFFWAALGFLVVAAVGGTAYVGMRAWRAWRAFVSLAVVGAAGLDLLTARSEALAVKAERVAAGAEELQASLARLQRSTARGRVLVGALDEAVDVVRAVLSYVPKT
jgi:hypothetical protein